MKFRSFLALYFVLKELYSWKNREAKRSLKMENDENKKFYNLEWREVKTKRKQYNGPETTQIKESGNEFKSFNRNNSFGSFEKNNDNQLSKNRPLNKSYDNYGPKSFNKNFPQKQFKSFSTSNVSEYKQNDKNDNFNKKKKFQREIPDFKDNIEKERFLKLKQEIPYIIMPGEARRMARDQNIAFLAERLLSDEYIEKQKEGWMFVKVIKPDSKDPIPDGDEYYLIEMDNKWGDVALFKKI